MFGEFSSYEQSSADRTMFSCFLLVKSLGIIQLKGLTPLIIVFVKAINKSHSRLTQSFSGLAFTSTQVRRK